VSPCCLQNCFTDIPLRSCAEIRVRQFSSLAPSFLATVDLVMGPLCGLANGVGRGVHRTFTPRPLQIAAKLDPESSKVHYSLWRADGFPGADWHQSSRFRLFAPAPARDSELIASWVETEKPEERDASL